LKLGDICLTMSHIHSYLYCILKGTVLITRGLDKIIIVLFQGLLPVTFISSVC